MSELQRAFSPKFEHDCDSCIYLGRFSEKDAYLCPKDLGSLILRYGDSGEEYSSSMVKLAIQLPPISELHGLAIELVRKGVITIGVDVEKIEKDDDDG